MTKKPDKLINLSVHESSDPSVISSNPNLEASANFNDLNDSVHDDDNVDVPTPEPLNNDINEDALPSQTMTANISAG